MTGQEYQTLSEAIFRQRDSKLAIEFAEQAGEPVDFASLYRRAEQLLSLFQQAGLQAGDHLILCTASNRDFIECFWACLLGGITVVPIAGGSSVEHRLKLLRVARKLGQAALFIDQAALQRLESVAIEQGFEDVWSMLQEHVFVREQASISGSDAELHAASPDDIAFVQFSSGSTSAPKGIVLTHRNLLVNVRSIMHGMAIEEHDRLLSWMPLTHDMGLIGFHLVPLVAGRHSMLMPTEQFVRRPVRWLESIEGFGATVTCSPNFGYQHLLKTFDPDKHVHDLSSVRLLFNGAEPISASLCRRFMQAMQPLGLNPTSLFPVYGLAEASLAVSFPPVAAPWRVVRLSRQALGVGDEVVVLGRWQGEGDLLVDPAGNESTAPGSSSIEHHDLDEGQQENGLTLVGVGQAVKDVGVSIRDTQGQVLAEGRVGHIHISGPNVTSGYLQDDELNGQMIDEQGALNTGDLGVVVDGWLYITGRAKDILFVNGLNVYPHDLEEILLRAGIVERGKVAISSRRSADNRQDELLVFLQHRGESEALLNDARAVMRTLSMQAGVMVSEVIAAPRIPKTTSGKVQRFELVRQLADGEIEAIKDPRRTQ